MENLTVIYTDREISQYIHKQMQGISSIVTNTEKLEWQIYSQIEKYIKEIKEKRLRVSYKRIRYLVDREIKRSLSRYRIQLATLYSDLAVTNGFGESLEYEPEDEVTDVGEDVLERTVESSLKGKIARLASDDFEEFVLQSWMLGDSDVEIARELALRNGGKVPSLVVKISRFRDRCKKRWTKETFVS